MTENADLVEKINQMAVDIAQIKTKLEMMPAPAKQPCPWYEQLRKEFDSHVRDRKQCTADWRRAILDGVVDLTRTAIIAGAGVLLGMIFGGII